MRRPVITGLGAVSPYGWGTANLWKGLRAGRPVIGPFDRFDHQSHRTHIAAQVPSPPEAFRRRLTRPRRWTQTDKFALGAVYEAVRHADIDLDACRGRAGVYFGSSTGGMFESELFYREFVEAGGGRVRLSRILSQECGAPGESVARHLRVEGPVETVSSACSSGSMAIGTAAGAVRSGEVDVALAGGSDSLCQLTYAGFNSLRLVSDKPSRPFRQDRSGLSMGEGAAVVVIETLERARARGVRPLVEIAGTASSCDASHMTAPDPGGEGAALAIAGALAEAGLAPGEIDFVNAHGTGTPLNDLAEWNAVHKVFGDHARRVPVTSTKACVGHLLGSAGALEAVATVLCLREGEVHPMPGGGEADPAIGFRLVLDTPHHLDRAGSALSLSLAFGGANAVLVFRNWEGGPAG
jgi:3-oxoacyl-[acyl-carrier-protein] synthase II